MTMAQIPLADEVENVEYLDEREIQNAEAVHISENMKKCYSLAQTVKWLAFIDFIFSMLYAFSDYYFLLPLCLTLLGIYGAKKYNKLYTILYLLYVFSINIVRLGIFSYVYYNLSSEDKENNAFSFITLTFCALVGLWIAKIVYKFIRSMNHLTPEELSTLRLQEQIGDYYTILW